MKHHCLNSSKTNWEHEDPCSCECTYCLELGRLRDLPEVSQEEMDWLWKVCYQEATAGPWVSAQMKGFGAMRFVLSESKLGNAEWHKVIAILENPGSFDADHFIAWCRDGVPRLLKHIEKLEEEKERLESLLDEANMHEIVGEGYDD